NSKVLASRTQPPSATKQGKLDPKHTQVICLYEECTSLLITNVKQETVKQESVKKEPTVTYTCVQTATTNSDERRLGLSFTLRCFEDMDEETGQSEKKVVYTPLGLEKESEEFVEQLDFLAGPFTFSRDQMPVFLDTVRKRLGPEEEPADGAEEDTPMEDA
ncbi:hypothetical protein M422DRAFT_272489, partial [Sphaerobolus stellatus SS14]